MSDTTASGKFYKKNSEFGIVRGQYIFDAAFFFLFCVARCHQFIGEIYVPGGLSISFAAVRLLWTVVSQSFTIQWNFDERYK